MTVLSLAVAGIWIIRTGRRFTGLFVLVVVFLAPHGGLRAGPEAGREEAAAAWANPGLSRESDFDEIPRLLAIGPSHL